MRVALTTKFSSAGCAKAGAASAIRATEAKNTDFIKTSPGSGGVALSIRKGAATPTRRHARVLPARVPHTPAGHRRRREAGFLASRIVAFARLPKTLKNQGSSDFFAGLRLWPKLTGDS